MKSGPGHNSGNAVPTIGERSEAAYVRERKVVPGDLCGRRLGSNRIRLMLRVVKDAGSSISTGGDFLIAPITFSHSSMATHMAQF